jgi:hypothetical protein
MKPRVKIFLDDIRTITGVNSDEWIIVRSASEFMETCDRIGFSNIELVSLDHDLGELSISEYYRNINNLKLDYANIKPELTGYDCAKFLVERWMDGEPVFDVLVHSANPIGSANIMGMVNAFRKIRKLPQNCVRIRWQYLKD